MQEKLDYVSIGKELIFENEYPCLNSLLNPSHGMKNVLKVIMQTQGAETCLGMLVSII